MKRVWFVWFFLTCNQPRTGYILSMCLKWIWRCPITSSLRQSLFSFSRYQHLFYSSFSHPFVFLCFHFPLTNTCFFFLLLSLRLSDSLCFHFPITNTFFILPSSITSSLRQPLFSFSHYQHLFYSSFFYHFVSQTVSVFIFPLPTPFLFFLLP